MAKHSALNLPARYAWGEATHRGERRENQDVLLSVQPTDYGRITQKGVLLALCDGVGGTRGGKLASELAAHAALEAYYDCPSPDTYESLRTAVAAANNAVTQEAARSDTRQMSSTIVLAVARNDMLVTAHVGDSRAYLLRGRNLMQLSTDHTLVAERVQKGILTQDQARLSSLRNQLTRSLGAGLNGAAEISTQPLIAGDTVLLCTDGLYNAVDESVIVNLLNKYTDPNQAALQLIQHAVAAEAQDNVSAIVLRSQVDHTRRPTRAWLVASLSAVALVATGVMGVVKLPGLLAASPTNTITVTLQPPTNGIAAVNTATLPATQAATDLPSPSPSATNTATPVPTATDTATPTATSTPHPTPTVALSRTPLPRPSPTAVVPTQTAPVIVLLATATAPTALVETPTPTATGVVTNGVSASATIKGDEPWGTPTDSTCTTFIDNRPSRRWRIELSVTNATSMTLASWHPSVIDGRGDAVPTCYEGQPLDELPPGGTSIVTVLAFSDAGSLNAILISSLELGQSLRLCFAGNQALLCAP